MALVEPLVGHLLSQYKETVLDGFEKIAKNAAADPSFTPAFLSNPQGIEALKSALQRSEYAPVVLTTLVTLINHCDAHSGCRSSLIRQFCSGKQMQVVRKALSALSDGSLPLCIAALQFLSLAATHHPKLMLARFDGKVPLHLACFRLQVPYSQRRVRAARARLLLNLATSKRAAATVNVVSVHGFLTHLLEDAAELLQEGTMQGVELGKEALRTFEEQFITSRILSRAQKVSILMAQRNVFRLLARALEFAPVAETAAAMIYRMVVEMIESPADYASTRVEAADDKGMPNFALFFLLRQLRPKHSALISRIVVFILHKAPDLIRPYFTRLSGHLADESSSARVAQSTARIATLNLMNRIFMAPIPYHLSALRVRLQPVAAKSTTFYAMSPRDVADEVCPLWMAEYVHRLINGSANLMTLTLAMQVTHATLQRAKMVLALTAQVQQQHTTERSGAGDDEDEDWETFDAHVQSCLLACIPRREEFWHRMTQQIHPLRLAAMKEAASGASTVKLEFVTQRMLLLMEAYTDVFQLRTSWLSAVPMFIPTFKPCATPILSALRAGNDVLSAWTAPSISALCSLLVSGLSKSVPMVKLHHVTLSNAKGGGGGITEWPLLLSLLLWAVQHRGAAHVTAETEEAMAWVARLVQWVTHSVTSYFGCEFAEAVLWVHSLTESSITCFVHMINHLMQRSLSKAADRVTQELLAGQQGLLVAAADAFVSRTVEKQAGAAEEERGAAVVKKGAGGKRQAAAGVQPDLWVADLKDSLGDFRTVLEAVRSQWAAREEVASTVLSRVYSSDGGSHNHHRRHGQRQLALAQYQASGSPVHVLLTVHEQLLQFHRSLRSPVQAESEAEAQAQALIMAHRDGGEGAGGHDGAGTLLMAQQRGVESVHSRLVSLGVVRWCVMPAVTWELSGRLMRELGSIREPTKMDAGAEEVQLHTLVAFTKEVWTLVAAAQEDLVVVLLEQRDSISVGFFVLLLSCLRVMLTARAVATPAAQWRLTSVVTAAEELDAVASMIMKVYTSSLSTADRVRYACLLSIHYLTASEEEDTPSALGEEQSVERRVFSGAMVPLCIATQRFLSWNCMPAINATPEVDMLTLLTDSWTDEELLSMALECPARLHNTLLCGARRPSWDLIRSVFPEVTCEEDLHVTPFTRITSASLVDPRYVLPLLQAVVSLPAEYLPHHYMGTRFAPLLVRALSFTDASLRSLAATTLTHTFIPSGPGRIVASFVRMKAVQLSTKRRGGEGVEIPRIPSPLSAYLVLAAKPLAHYSDVLHNHFVRFLMDTNEAFAAPVPFAQWLTLFPLGCVNVPLMVKRQEELQAWSGATSSIAQTSAAELADQWQKDAPPQLAFMLRLVAHACQTNGDAMALIESECLEGLMMLSSMVAASPELRQSFVECLTSVCDTSFAVADQVATRGHVLLWLLAFVTHLGREYGGQTHLYSEPLYLAVLALLEKLSAVAKASAEMDAVSRQQMRVMLHLVRGQLDSAKVTAKTTLDAVDGVLEAWAQEGRGHHSPQQHRSQASKRSRSAGESARGKPKGAVPRKRQRQT